MYYFANIANSIVVTASAGLLLELGHVVSQVMQTVKHLNADVNT